MVNHVNDDGISERESELSVPLSNSDIQLSIPKIQEFDEEDDNKDFCVVPVTNIDRNIMSFKSSEHIRRLEQRQKAMESARSHYSSKH